MRQLSTGERSRELAKPLKGSASKEYETCLEQKSGHRILWQHTTANTILIWYVAKHKTICKRAWRCWRERCFVSFKGRTVTWPAKRGRIERHCCCSKACKHHPKITFHPVTAVDTELRCADVVEQLLSENLLVEVCHLLEVSVLPRVGPYLQSQLEKTALIPLKSCIGPTITSK